MKRNVYGLVLALLALSAPAFAQPDAQDEGNPANWCRGGPFTGEGVEYKLARAVGRKGARVYFHGDDGEGCPGPTCRLRSYLVPGDQVIVARSFGDWLCAWYQPARGPETVGWIKAHELSVAEPERDPPAARWEGEWGYYENGLSVRREARTGRLSVSGNASWRGANPGQVNVGAFEAKGAPAGGVLKLGDDTCRVTLWLVGPYLLAEDNKQCGGFNVTFDGVYRRRPPRRKR